MRGAAGLVGILVVVGAGYFVYDAQLMQSAAVGAPPQQQIDVTGIKASLLEIGQAQRIYLAAHGAYGTLEQLRADNAPHLGVDQRGYVFDVQPNGAQGFIATAAPANANPPGRPTLTIDETMQVTAR